jgi:hypothetical protein
MTFNYRTINAFCDYNSFENFYLRNSSLGFKLVDSFESIKITRSFSVNNYFDFIRFFSLITFIFGYRKPLAFSKFNSFFILSRTLNAKFLYFFLRNLAKFQKSPKGSFMKIVYFENGAGLMRIREPHVAFSTTSPYFDYHNSKLSLNFDFLYRDNPQFLYKLVWLFGTLTLTYSFISLFIQFDEISTIYFQEICI